MLKHVDGMHHNAAVVCAWIQSVKSADLSVRWIGVDIVAKPLYACKGIGRCELVHRQVHIQILSRHYAGETA